MEIDLDPHTLDRLNAYLRDSSFKDLSQLIRFILNDFLEQNETGNAASENEDDTLNRRLKDLGYF